MPAFKYKIGAPTPIPTLEIPLRLVQDADDFVASPARELQELIARHADGSIAVVPNEGFPGWAKMAILFFSSALLWYAILLLLSTI